jgi:hypothetical protein
MKRNPMAGGGMLVQPGFGGTRQGYAMSKEDKAAYMREYYKSKPRKMTKRGAKRVETAKVLDEYIKTLGKVVNTDDLYKKLEELGFKGKDITSKVDKLKKNKLKGKTFTKKTPKKQETRMDKNQLKEFDKYAKYLKEQGVEGMGDTYKTSTNEAQQSIRNRAYNRGGKFTLDKEKDPKDFFTESQKNKIKAAFNISDADFDAAGNKFGVPSGDGVTGEEGKALRRRYANVRAFVDRGFKEGSQTLASGLLRKEDQLPLKIQTEIKTAYELPEDYINRFTGKREWDFERYTYGVPAGNRNLATKKMARKIEYEFKRDPKTKTFKFVGDFKTPNGWMMAQMFRSGVEQGSPNYEPLYGKVNDVKKIVGFTDNIVGEDFYVRDEFIKGDGKPMRLHPDFDNVKKFIDVAKKANAPLNDTLKGMLKQIGVVDDRMTMTTLLNYLAEKEGLKPTNRALVLHHKGGVYENATRDLQLLRNINNKKIQNAETRIRNTVNLGETPNKADIKTLKDNRATVTVGGQTFGSGPQTPEGAFRSYEKFIADKIKDRTINKKEITKYADSLKVFMGDLAGTVNKTCIIKKRKVAKDGGRIGFKFGTASPDCDKLAKQLIQKSIQGEGTPQQRSITNKIIKGGSNLIKSALDPVELLKLRNYVGPQALGFFAAYEAGVIADDVLRMNKPLNEAVASNWLTKSFLPYTEEFAKQENLLKSGTLTGNQRLFALDAMKYNKLLKEVERIEGMEATQLTDQGGMGMIDGTPMVPQAEIDKAMANVTRIAETIDPAVLDPRSAKAIENKAKMDEMEATRMAKKKFSPIFGFDKLKNRAENVDTGDYLPDPLKIDLSPITYRNVEDFKPVTELPAERRIALEDMLLPKNQYKPMDRSLSNFQYRDSDKTILEDELEEYNRSQRFKQAFEQPGMLGANEKFATGGRAGFKVGDTVRKGVLSLIDEGVKKTPKDMTSDLDALIKKTLDEDFFDKKDRIIDNINAKIARARAKGLDSEEIGEGQIEFYDDIIKSNFRTKTGPFFDYQKRKNRAGGGILKQAGDSSGPPPESGPMSEGLQGLIKRGIKT